jgi:hypothetical protein
MKDEKTTTMRLDPRLLSGMGVLAPVIEGGSFTRAGEMLGLSASGVSRALARPGRQGLPTRAHTCMSLLFRTSQDSKKLRTLHRVLPAR